MKKLSRDQLKIITAVLMVIDHFAIFFLPYGSAAYTVIRNLDRACSVPFLILFAEGMSRTEHPERHLPLLALCGIISEPFWSYMDYGKWHSPGACNIMWLYFITCFCITFMREMKKSPVSYGGQLLENTLCIMFTVTVTGIANPVYGIPGAVIILISYWLIGHRHEVRSSAVTGCIIESVAALNPFYLLGIPLMYAYDPGIKCKRNTFMKYFYYALYPLHLAVFTLIKILLR